MLSDIVITGIDLLVFGCLWKKYGMVAEYVRVIEEAPRYVINRSLKEHVASQSNQTVPYAAVCGTAKAVSLPIRAQYADIFGVIQRVNTSDLTAQRDAFGFWRGRSEIIHFNAKAVPFKLLGDHCAVLVSEPLRATILEASEVYHNYVPMEKRSVAEYVLGFFAGVWRKGLLTIESVVPENTMVTGIGELKIVNGELCLNPSAIGPMVLTPDSQSLLISRLKDEQSAVFSQLVLFGAVTVAILCYYSVKYYKLWQKSRVDSLRREQIEAERRRNLARGRTTAQLSEPELCVVCKDNPREIYLRPCGHVCICNDCCESLQTNECPVCRQVISERSVAFLP